LKKKFPQSLSIFYLQKKFQKIMTKIYPTGTYLPEISFVPQRENGPLEVKRHNPHDQGSHQNAWIIASIDAFFVFTLNNQVIHQPLFDLNILLRLTSKFFHI